MPPVHRLLADGRWHFQHGPIDAVIGADGDAAAVAAAHDAAGQRFATVLSGLVVELPLLRQPVVGGGACPLQGPIARRMWAACQPHSAAFITPMAAVAGAVAQELIAAYDRPGVDRAWVNNGGDIALQLAAGRSVRVGLVADLARFDARALAALHGAVDGRGGGSNGTNGANGADGADHTDGARGSALALDARLQIDSASPVRGIATSGWRGRSFSLGIADSVTVLAATAAAADAAATVIANACNADDARIERRPANTLKDDSDLGAIRVTVNVPPLPLAAVRGALQAGAACAAQLRERGLIVAALLVCQGQQLAVPAVRAAGHADGAADDVAEGVAEGMADVFAAPQHRVRSTPRTVQPTVPSTAHTAPARGSVLA